MSSRKEICRTCEDRDDCGHATMENGPQPYCPEKLREDFEKPRPDCRLTGSDGNAFAIIGNVRNCLTRDGQKEAAIAFSHEATQGDYNNVLITAMKYVNVS